VFNVPVYGSEIPKAIMKFYQSSEILKLAKELQIRIPQYKLQSFVQSKMFKVKVLVKAARELGGCDEQAGKLERFVVEFEKLKAEDVPDPAAWKSFVEQHVSAGWERRLHFNDLLQNFGFDAETAKKLREQQYTEVDQKTGEENTSDLKTYAFRWLGKAFAGYNITGCLTDVANLVFAMAEHDVQQQDPSKLTEFEIAEKISTVADKVNKGNLSGLWVPTHLVHDSETDDLLGWLLLEHIHHKLGSDLEVLVQMPPSGASDLNECIEKMSARKNVHVFRDKDSKNDKAVREALGLAKAK